MINQLADSHKSFRCIFSRYSVRVTLTEERRDGGEGGGAEQTLRKTFRICHKKDMVVPFWDVLRIKNKQTNKDIAVPDLN